MINIESVGLVHMFKMSAILMILNHTAPPFITTNTTIALTITTIPTITIREEEWLLLRAIFPICVN